MRVRSVAVLQEQHQLSLIDEYHQTRALTGWLCENLETEDYVIQPSAEVSPPKWHLAHTTWFFEQFILKKFNKSYREFSPDFSLLFNSYYKSQGTHWPQESRGTLSRPTVKEVLAYRNYVDQAMDRFFNQTWLDGQEPARLLRAGIEHEKQHQELLLMDIKAIFARNHPSPAYFKKTLERSAKFEGQRFDFYVDGIYEVGSHEGQFSFDNENPRHRVLAQPFGMSNRWVTNAQYLEFINDSGYEKPELWLSDGWNWIETEKHKAPLYWRSSKENGWQEFTLHGLVTLDENAPVCHVNYYEASAYAKWAGCRLPDEHEYEIFLRRMNSEESHDQNIGVLTGQFHPTHSDNSAGELWAWTRSPYGPYPGYAPFDGPLSEYNGKFMVNQFVLRGGCVATPAAHFRASYRNFYLPHQRWMFSGIRLARDAS